MILRLIEGPVCSTLTTRKEHNMISTCQIKLHESHLLSTKHASEQATEDVCFLLFWLIDTFLSTAIIFASFFSITEDFVCVGDVMEFLLGVFVSCVSVRMVLQRQLSIALFDVRCLSIPFQLEDLIEVSLLRLRLSSSHGRIPQQHQD